MTIRFEDIKPRVGSRVLWDDRNELFTREAAELLIRKLAERTGLVFPKVNLTDQEQLKITDLMGGNVKLTGAFFVLVVALAAAGLQVKSIRDVTPIPHNGCRPSKRRRV